MSRMTTKSATAGEPRTGQRTKREKVKVQEEQKKARKTQQIVVTKPWGVVHPIFLIYR